MKKLINIGNIYVLRQHLDSSKLKFDFLSHENKKKLYEKADITVPMDVIDTGFYEAEIYDRCLKDISLETDGPGVMIKELKTIFFCFDYVYLYDVKRKRWRVFNKYEYAEYELAWEIGYKPFSDRLRKTEVIKNKGGHSCNLITCMEKMSEQDLEFKKTAHHDFINRAIEVLEDIAGQPIYKIKIKYPDNDLFPSIKTIKETEDIKMYGKEICIYSTNAEKALDGLSYLKFIKSNTRDNTNYKLSYNSIELYALHLGKGKYCDVIIDFEDFTYNICVRVDIHCYRQLNIKDILDY